MSTTAQNRRVSVPELRARKGETPIVSLTAYTTPMARVLDAHMDMLLVGDSLGNVVMGEETTILVTLEIMIHHTRCVSNGARRAVPGRRPPSNPARLPITRLMTRFMSAKAMTAQAMPRPSCRSQAAGPLWI